MASLMGDDCNLDIMPPRKKKNKGSNKVKALIKPFFNEILEILMLMRFGNYFHGGCRIS